MAAADVVRRLLPYTTAAVIAAAVYAGWVMYSRYSAARQAHQRLEEQNRKRAVEAGRQIERQFGGDELKILSFSADRKVTSPGDRVLLCYGVSNAVSVKIEPEIEPIKPAVSRCIEAFPKRTTKYTLTAVDARGNAVRSSLTVGIR